jgi:hypothetical protein
MRCGQVPKYVEDETEVLSKMLTPAPQGWGLRPPSLTVSMSSEPGDYCSGRGCLSLPICLRTIRAISVTVVGLV